MLKRTVKFCSGSQSVISEEIRFVKPELLLQLTINK